MPIGTRLRLVFACVLTFMFLGSGVSLWYLDTIRRQVERVSLIEQRMTAVLQIDNGVLKLLNQLYRAAETNRSSHFSNEAGRLLDAFRSETGWATGMLRGIQPDDGRQRVIFDSLNVMLEALPGRIQSVADLARAEDWVALHARLRNQIDNTDDVVAALVSDINASLIESRRGLVVQVQQAQQRTVEVLIVTGLLGLSAAALLGLVVTRSITRPLASLEAGTRALYEGKLGFALEVEGNDELTHLAVSFNRSFRELEEIYARLRNSEAHFRSLIENASDLIMIVSRKGEILYASPSSTRLLGSGGKSVQGRLLQDFVHPEDGALLGPLLTPEEQASGETRNFELRVRSHDQTFRVLEGVAKDLWVDGTAANIVVNARDVTERRAAEQALRDREDQLRQAQKLEGIGLLAGGVAHDFNNLLTVINGYSSFLLQTLNPRDETHGYAKSILQAGERAAELTRQLLAFGRKQMLRPEVLNLNSVVADVARLLRRLVGEHIELRLALDRDVGKVEVDQNQLHQVLMNLSSNARDAMPLGGILSLETANVTFEQPSLASGTTIPPGRYVRLTVHDSGHGMDETTQQRIFEPFFTTKEQGKGTGLGLASVYGVVRQSGGHIALDSTVGQGSSFYIYLPRIDHASEPLPASAAPSESTEGTETILVVEDEADVRQFASRSLRNCGYHVIEAADAQEALKLYQVNAGKIRVLLTDVVMPGMSGVELSKCLLALDSQLKVIYVSGDADAVQPGWDGRGAAGETFLQKPYRPRELAAKVREVLAD